MRSFLTFISKILPQKTFGFDNEIKWLAAGEWENKVILLGFRKQFVGGHFVNFESEDGVNFSPSGKNFSAEISDGKNFRLFKFHNDLFLTSVDSSLVIQKKSDEEKFDVVAKVEDINETGSIVPNYRFKGNYVQYFGEGDIKVAFSKDFKDWQIIEKPVFSSRQDSFDRTPLKVIGSHIMDKGLLVIYDCSFQDDKNHVICGGVLFSLSDPGKVIWRSELPLFEEVTDIKGEVNPLGVIVNEENVFLYWALGDNDLLISSIPMPFSLKVSNGVHLLKRHPANPIISPNENHGWESEGTFNSAAIYLDGKVHIIYRAVGKNGLSTFGYAVSGNGYDIDERLDHPIYYPRGSFEGLHGKPLKYKDLKSKGFYASGGGWGGCEDPKLTKIGDRIYMTYVAFNGYEPQRVAITSISENDFKNKNWEWDDPVLMSAPDVINKSACLLPEKIGNKFVVFHRIFPDILIDYVDDLKFEKNNWLTGHAKIPARPSFWDSRKLSVGATPIKTDLGWLVIYHAIDDRDPSRYKIGAMILDHEDLSKVLYRTNQPILVPEETYENDGKPGVVYPSGAVVIDNDLFVYYGGGDKVVCVATTPMEHLLNHLKSKENEQFSLEKINKKVYVPRM